MGRFRFAADGRRYLTCHANMRKLLASYAECLPQELTFVFNEFGKPRLEKQKGEPLYFNLSHSGDIGLLAVSRMGDLGADIENVRPIEPDVAEEHFSEIELAQLKTMSGDAWLEGFYRCWTRKEAILKAEGCGLNLPLDAFDVSILPDEPALLRAVRPEITLSRHWKLTHLEPEPGAIGAIAADASYPVLRCFRLGS